jgi:cytosine/adenosine deaminase-related metal-dependent hydrolase
LENGVVTVRGDELLAVGRHALDCPVRDLGDVALLPGLVNAHTHLDLSDLPAPLGAPGEPLAQWIPRVIAHRRQGDRDPSAAIAQGLRESLAAGVTAIGDIFAGPAWPADHMSSPGRPDLMVFREFIALGPQWPQQLAAARSWLADFASRPAAGLAPGLSPHAPYTVHAELLAALVGTSAAGRSPVAMHLAESAEELELLACGRGPLVEMLSQWGAWHSDGIVARRPLDVLRQLAGASRALVIHGTLLDAEEIQWLAARRERLAVVYCPRTTARFAAAHHPLERLLQAGATVGLGTDSRASSPDLALLEELRAVVRLHPGVSPGQALELATLGGARALGRAAEFGSLERGKLAHLTAVRLPSASPADPHESLLDAACRVQSTWCRGRVVFDAG